MAEAAARATSAKAPHPRRHATAQAARRAPAVVPGHASTLAPAARAVQPRCACGGKAGAGGSCEECKRRRPDLQRRTRPGAPSDGAGGASPLPPSPGRPLDGTTRRFFERRFGHGFGDVRVHDDARAAAAAREADALAFTSGRDIVFAAGRYEPAVPRGLRLLAHELTHVVQQRAGLASTRDGGRDEPAEHEAERNAERLHTREPMRFDMRAPALARQPADATAAPAPAPCNEDRRRAIDPVLALALEQTGTALQRLDAWIAAPRDAANAGTRAALEAHFRSTDDAVVARVRHVLQRARDMLDARQRDPSSIVCNSADDRRCNSFDAIARGDTISLCPGFFGDDRQHQATLLVHEVVHALPDTDDDPHIPDRAYARDRMLRQLTTDEAVNNAESYSMFVQEIATGSEVRGTPPEDDIEDCPRATRQAIERSLALGQRWTSIAAMAASSRSDRAMFTTHLGDAEPATVEAAERLYSRMKRRLYRPVDVRCDDPASSSCSSDRRAWAQRGDDRSGTGAGIGAGVGALVGLIGGIAAGIAAAPIIGAGLAVLLGAGVTALGALLGAAIGGLIGWATSTPAAVHVCPDWISLPDEGARTESLLAAVYETYGDVDADRARRHAALAHALHDDFPGRAPAATAPRRTPAPASTPATP